MVGEGRKFNRPLLPGAPQSGTPHCSTYLWPQSHTQPHISTHTSAATCVTVQDDEPIKFGDAVLPRASLTAKRATVDVYEAGTMTLERVTLCIDG